MAASPPGSWPGALEHAEKPDPAPFESIKPGLRPSNQTSGHGYGRGRGRGGEADEMLSTRKETAEQIAILPLEILEQ